MKAALYARISTTERKQALETQFRQLRAYARRLKWRVAHEFSDVQSGAAIRRPGLDALMRGAAERRFDVVLVFELSRLTRTGPASALALIQRLDHAGVEFRSLTEEHFRTSGPAGPLLIAVAAWIAEQERAYMRQRIRAGLDRARAQGVRLGRRRVVVNRDKVRALRRSGKTFREIARALGHSKSTIERAAKA